MHSVHSSLARLGQGSSAWGAVLTVKSTISLLLGTSLVLGTVDMAALRLEAFHTPSSMPMNLPFSNARKPK